MGPPEGTLSFQAVSTLTGVSDIQGFRVISLHYFKPPSLWWFVPNVSGIEHLVVSVRFGYLCMCVYTCVEARA